MNYHIQEPATPLAAQWQGHRYGLQALKPAAEPIIVAQLPYQGRPVDSIVGTGAGALNIDRSRISVDWDNDPNKRGWQGGNLAIGKESIFGNDGDRVALPSA